jgi:hypothetical protein
MPANIDYNPLDPVSQAGNIVNACQTYSASDATHLARALAGLPMFNIDEMDIYVRGQAYSRGRGFAGVNGPIGPGDALFVMARDGYRAVGELALGQHKLVYSNYTGAQSHIDWIAQKLAARCAPIITLLLCGLDANAIMVPAPGGVPHAMRVDGIFFDTQLVGCANMYGDSWGNSGRCFIRFADFSPVSQINAQGSCSVDSLIEAGANVPPPVIIPPETPVTYNEIIAALSAQTWNQSQIDAFCAAARLTVVTPPPPAGTVVFSPPAANITAPDNAVFGHDGWSVNRNNVRVGVVGRYIGIIARDSAGNIKVQDVNSKQWFIYPTWAPTSTPV